MPSQPAKTQVTTLLGRWRGGDEQAFDELLSQVYDELRRLARAQLARRPSASLQPTGLVAEAYFKLAGSDQVDWQNRAHFFSVAALAMRRLLIDRYRRYQADRRGAGQAAVTIQDELLGAQRRPIELDRLEDALTELESLDPRQAKIVTLKFYGGLKVEEVAAVLDISPRTVKREWAVAKLWLHRELKRE